MNLVQEQRSRGAGSSSQNQAPIREGGAFHFPEGNAFAFTILDDTDDSTLANVKPVYDLLHELGMRTTKTVWPLDCPEGSRIYFAAETLGNAPYREFVHELKERGFELTWHCATMESSDRARTIKGLEFFRSEFGSYPTIHCNHGQNRENIYWGPRRYRTLVLRPLAKALRGKRDPGFSGEREGSTYFWGDLCKKHFRFVRNFTFHEINTLKCDPHMPYTLRATGYVNYWFSTSDAADVHEFKRLITPANIDHLCGEGGMCILSTHLGKGFTQEGRVDPEVEATLRHIASLPGWFVPVSDMLEFLLARKKESELSWSSRVGLEFRHAFDRILGTRSW